MRTANDEIQVKVTSVADLAPDIKRFDLVRCDGAPFPDASAGAHVTVHMTEDLRRPYSLIVSGTGLKAYAIAVKHEPHGEGGSNFMHTQVSAGVVLSIAPPTNAFPLAEGDGESIFIAGGIGITPIWSMIQECKRSTRPWKLFYAARSRNAAAFVDALEDSPHVRMFYLEAGGEALDVKEIVRNAPCDAHLYCCGPKGMIAAFQSAAREHPPSHVHFESFTPAQIAGDSQPITIELARTGKSLHVPADKSILEVLVQSGIRVPFSCRQGVCGSCEVEVLAGAPDHRDAILSEAERASNKTMMTCCSRSKNGRLVLNI